MNTQYGLINEQPKAIDKYFLPNYGWDSIHYRTGGSSRT